MFEKALLSQKAAEPEQNPCDGAESSAAVCLEAVEKVGVHHSCHHRRFCALLDLQVGAITINYFQSAAPLATSASSVSQVYLTAGLKTNQYHLNVQNV